MGLSRDNWAMFAEKLHSEELSLIWMYLLVSVYSGFSTSSMLEQFTACGIGYISRHGFIPAPQIAGLCCLFVYKKPCIFSARSGLAAVFLLEDSFTWVLAGLVELG